MKWTSLGNMANRKYWLILSAPNSNRRRRFCTKCKISLILFNTVNIYVDWSNSRDMLQRIITNQLLLKQFHLRKEILQARDILNMLGLSMRFTEIHNCLQREIWKLLQACIFYMFITGYLMLSLTHVLAFYFQYFTFYNLKLCLTIFPEIIFISNTALKHLIIENHCSNTYLLRVT